QVRNEAAGLAELLGFSEKKVGLLELSLCALSGLDIERGDIPSIDSSLLVEQRIVAEQHPFICAVPGQHTLLIFERDWACERVAALLVKSCHVLRVENTSAIVRFLHIFQSETGVFQHRSIRIERGSIAA